jgi:VanZ family protein
MPIERLACLTLAAAITVAILLPGGVPIPAGWDKVAHFAAFSALTFCLWQATGGAMPLLVLGGVIAFGALDEYRQAALADRVSDASDFLADLGAVLATGAALFLQRKPVCAESSRR